MNTPAHLIFAAAAFARPDKPKSTWAAIAGGLAPDFSLYFMVFWSRFISGTDFRVIFNELYFSSTWQQVFAIDNSAFLWIGLVLIGWYTARYWLLAFGGGGLLHIALDFPLHHDDGRMHFWPISDWIFESPISYWDPHHYGGVIGPIEVILVAILTFVLLRRFWGTAWVWFFGAVATLQIAPFIIWGLMF